MRQIQQVAVFSFTGVGTGLNKRICRFFTEHGYQVEGYTVNRYASEEIKPLPENRKQFMKERWGSCIFVFIGAAGIAVRQIAPFVKDKFTDSPVLVLDEKGEYVIPILSGHLGGAARLATVLAEWMGDGTTAVQTTATDVQGKFAVDVYAKENHLILTDRTVAKQISAAVLKGESVGFWIEPGIQAAIPQETQVTVCASEEELRRFAFGIVIHQNAWNSRQKEEKQNKSKTEILELLPQNIIAGIGCRKGTTLEELETGLKEVLEANQLDYRQICLITSIDLKKKEQGLLELSEKYGVPFVTYTKEELETIREVSSHSEFVRKTTGVDNVCERAAKYADQKGGLLQEKCQKNKMTVAFVRKSVYNKE